MIYDFKPRDEEGRVRALERLEVLDTQPEAPFETIVGLIRQVLQVPISTVTLIDRDRQWFKARCGIESCETGRSVSFCTFTIEQPDALILRDATKDPRFAGNPYVVGPPYIRAYAGMPLRISEGYNVGSVCAIDTRPRSFSAAEITILRQFARTVVSELELREIASTDHLTGALSRRGWMMRAKEEFADTARSGEALTAAILDIDRFKWVNDRYGHSAGDNVLRTLANLIFTHLGERQLFGRLGGEEFAILFPGESAAEARETAENIRSDFQATAHDLGEIVRSTVSFGIAERPQDCANIDALLKQADIALYEAKRLGRNRTVIARCAPSQKPSSGMVA